MGRALSGGTCQNHLWQSDFTGMWLFTTEGFFSAVSDRNDEGTIIVRSRVRDDAARLVNAVGVGRVIETRDSDYRFRVGLPRAAWVAYVAAAAEAID
jgi:hypothetical protein